ncbi:hypothetical protein [uncultured Robinsoniella sp.]|uniref:hypothetical protein n=1 Tax=uncultured Robinsoniella sp. TaxID=904190 RepID=UPI002067BF62|nr:MAG TPA: hypothetical protein [Caudoviricetes sp.]
MGEYCLKDGSVVLEEDIEKAIPNVMNALRNSLPKEYQTYTACEFTLSEVVKRMGSKFMLMSSEPHILG